MAQPSAKLTRQLDLERQRQLINRKVIELLHQYPYSSAELKAASIYSVGSAGHRWRPILFMRIYEKLNTSNAYPDAIPVACAIEFLHTASLILDDLPSMDDGNLRRGKKACHREFGESRTILTAHWLCDVAQYYIHDFASITKTDELENAFLETKSQMMRGQILDLENENLNQAEIIEKCWLNSGALYSFCGWAPASILNVPAIGARLRRFGYYLGTAYQIADDISDMTSTTMELGKDVQKDVGNKTLLSVCGVEKAIEFHHLYKNKALKELEELSFPAGEIAEIVELVCMF
jgi:geranylgeranyl diphosphate synthase type II